MNTVQEKRTELADVKSQQWLARLNELEEAGKSDTKACRDAKRKAQFWLDRLNRLIGQN